MNSLEALEKFKLLYESKCKEQPKNLIGFDMCYITIKQDLKAYEQLNKDHDITLINNGELVVKVADLQKENKELLINKNFAQGVALKYKKAIEFLKDKLEFEDLGEMQSGNVYRPYFNDCFDQPEYDLFKEVLGDE